MSSPLFLLEILLESFAHMFATFQKKTNMNANFVAESKIYADQDLSDKNLSRK
jgi:hypothetical protein